MTTKKKKSAKQRRVLIIAVIVAIAIVAGSTFAWFTSMDEVTNRLSASADYNVAIAEDFQAPEEWIPGQTINKDVSAVNTGSVDAFVRMWLGGQLRVLNKDIKDTNDVVLSNFSLPNPLNVVTDAKMLNLGFTHYSADNYYYKTLSTKQIDNPNDEANASAPDEQTNQPAAFSEVQAMQAAGVLAYAPDNAVFSWTLEQPATLDVVTTSTVGHEEKYLAKGTKVGTTGATGIAEELNGAYFGPIDASTFKPETTGLYLFRRNIQEAADRANNKYEYSGYYYDAANDLYFALDTVDATHPIGSSDYVLPDGAVQEDTTTNYPTSDLYLPVTPQTGYIKLLTATETFYDTSDLTWTYANSKFTVTNATATKPISIEIQLANIGSSPEGWTAIGDNSITETFYYNNDLEAGDTTVKLVDSVTLDGATENGAYLAFDFDLNVFMDSVQVTIDADNKESGDAISDGWAAITGKNTGAAGTTTGDGEITSVSWQ